MFIIFDVLIVLSWLWCSTIYVCANAHLGQVSLERDVFKEADKVLVIQ